MDRREYKKCVTDESRIYIIEKYLLPIYEDVEGKNFLKFSKDHKCALTKSQKEILKSFDGKNSLYVNKSRRVGITSLFILKIAADIILSEGNEVFLFYGCNQASFNIVKRGVENILLNCPEDIWTFIPPYKEKTVLTINDRLVSLPFSKRNLIFNTDNFGNFVDGFEVKNGCVLKHIYSPSDIDVKDGIYNHRGVMKKVKYAVLDEWLFKDNFKIIIEYLKNEKISMLMATTPKCDTDLCYDIAKEFKDKGQFIEALWDDCPWTKPWDIKKSYVLNEVQFLEESGKIFKMVML